MHFDFSDIKLFLHLAEVENLTKGASAAALSPAAASGRLKALEEQLQTRLFYRSSRGLQLTYSGELFLKHARIISRQVENAKSDFGDLNCDSIGKFRIFSNTTPITEILPAALQKFLKTRPQVTVDIQERNTQEIVRGVVEGAADLGFLSVPSPFDTGELASLRLTSDRLILATPADHPLSGMESISFSESLDFPHVGLRESTLQQYVLDQANLLKKRLTMRVLVSSYETLCSMIDAQIGIGVLPESCARRYVRTGKELNIIELTDPWSIRERLVIYRDRDALPMCARVFLDSLSSWKDSGPP